MYGLNVKVSKHFHLGEVFSNLESTLWYDHLKNQTTFLSEFEKAVTDIWQKKKKNNNNCLARCSNVTVLLIILIQKYRKDSFVKTRKLTSFYLKKKIKYLWKEKLANCRKKLKFKYTWYKTLYFNNNIFITIEILFKREEHEKYDIT